MRIVAGKWAGKSLTSPGGRVRPTAEAVRDAVLSMFDEHTIRTARVLDLYAGTGAVGLEALSRGARAVDFVENGTAALHALKANIARFHARDRTRIFKHEVMRFLDGVESDAYDLIFADPPYTSKQSERVVEWWLARRPASTLVIEHGADRTLPAPGRRTLFGDTAITRYSPTS